MEPKTTNSEHETEIVTAEHETEIVTVKFNQYKTCTRIGTL